MLGIVLHHNVNSRYSRLQQSILLLLLKGPLAHLSQFLENKSRLRMKHAFYFALKALLILKIFEYLP